MKADYWVVVNCLIMYWYNVRFSEIAEALFPASAQSYLDEKAKQMRDEGLDGFWGSLDYEHQMKLVSLARDKYWTESEKRSELNRIHRVYG